MAAGEYEEVVVLVGSTRRSSLQLPQRTMVWPPWAGRRRCSSIAVSCATDFVGLWRFVEVCGQLWADREEDEEEGEVSQQQQQAKERRCPGSTCNGHGHRRRGATRMRPSSTIRAGRRKAPSVLRRSGPGNSRGRFYDWRLAPPRNNQQCTGSLRVDAAPGRTRPRAY